MNLEEKRKLMKDILEVMKGKNTTFEDAKAVLEMLDMFIEQKIKERKI
ncbi:hypothetical protein [Melissococcus plutonius]